MSDVTAADDFYEEDEPIEKVFAAYEKAEKGRTMRPGKGTTEYLVITGLSLAGETESDAVNVKLAAA